MESNLNDDLTKAPVHSSKLLAQRSNEPSYLSSEEELSLFVEAELPGHFEAIVEYNDLAFAIFGIIDKNQPECPVTDLKFVSKQIGEKLGFIDVTLEMCIDKNEQTLGFLSFREIESFLRDENQTPSLPDKGITYYPLFQKIIAALKDSIVKSRGHRTGEPASPTIADDYQASNPPLYNKEQNGLFSEQSIRDQNVALNQVMAKHIRPFLYRDNGDIEVLFIDGAMVVVNYLGACAHCTKSLTTTMDYIQTVLRLELLQPDLLVVTDS